MCEKAGIGKDEWLIRCADRYIKNGYTQRKFAIYMAWECWLDAGPDEEPEEMADSDMSYWEA